MQKWNAGKKHAWAADWPRLTCVEGTCKCEVTRGGLNRIFHLHFLNQSVIADLHMAQEGHSKQCVDGAVTGGHHANSLWRLLMRRTSPNRLCVHNQ